MNIDNFESSFDRSNFKEAGIIAIFKKQKQLMEKYREIESKNGFYYPESLIVDVNSMQGQTLLKNMSWRVIEEVGEALEARFVYDDLHHYNEEMIDGLHFFTELLILSGKDYVNFINSFNDNTEIVEDKVFFNWRITNLVKKLGVTMNCLKMKPWAQTHNLTDLQVYSDKLDLAYLSYLEILKTTMRPWDILNYYFKKAQVNNFRQQSNY